MIEIIPYQAHWPKTFSTVGAKIRGALGETALTVHHIGSTSVPGLGANVGEVKVKYQRPIPEGATIKHVVVKRMLDKWFINLMLELPGTEPVSVPPTV